MSYGVSVLCRPEVGAGFRLAGLRPQEFVDVTDGVAGLRALLQDPASGVVLVEESLYNALPDDLRGELARRPLPMVVPFPGPQWAERREAAEAYIIELLRQVIGYRVRLK
jgi:vacuolar-type H+-ATPase subunit F/Vma7